VIIRSSSSTILVTRPFIPGLELSERFFREAVQPILAACFPQLVYSAARLDFGSDVLGFDTPQSMDHGWGPKATLFVSDTDWLVCRDQVTKTLAEKLPYEIHGYPTNFQHGDLSASDLFAIDHGPVNHGVTVTTTKRFFENYIGFDPTQPIDEVSWLVVPQQRLRTIASGRVFHDGLHQIQVLRAALAWYPHDMWLYLLANQWRRIDQEEPFMARCGDAGDEPGSRLVAARLVTELMRLGFLMERQYAPYMKWLGTAFRRLVCAGQLIPIFQRVFDSASWKEREQHLSDAYVIMIEQHNALHLTPSIAPEVTLFFERPYWVPHAERLVDALHGQMTSPAIKALPRYVGAVWQFADSTDVLDSLEKCQSLAAAIYG